MIDSAIDKMNVDMQHMTCFAKQKLEPVCVERARSEGLYYDFERKILPTNFTEVVKAWGKYASEELRGIMFDTIIGQFDLDPRWAFRYETEYMTNYDYVYIDTPSSVNLNGENTKVGCIQGVMRAAKKAMLRRINYAARNTGIVIGTHRDMTKVQKEENSKWKRRTKGVLEPCLIRRIDEEKIEEQKERDKQVRNEDFDASVTANFTSPYWA